MSGTYRTARWSVERWVLNFSPLTPVVDIMSCCCLRLGLAMGKQMYAELVERSGQGVPMIVSSGQQHVGMWVEHYSSSNA